MREFLLANAPVIVWILTILETILLILLFRHYLHHKQPIAFCMTLVCFGLVYDALIIATGAILPEGLFFVLSQIRFISHGILVPLNLLICAYALRWDGLKMKIMYGITGIISLLGLAAGIVKKLEIVDFAGIIRCKSSSLSPAWSEGIHSLISYGTVFPLIIFGIIVWIKQKTPFLFLSGLLMFVFSALAPATGNFDLIFLISMFGECFMVLFFLLYAQKYSKAKT